MNINCIDYVQLPYQKTFVNPSIIPPATLTWVES